MKINFLSLEVSYKILFYFKKKLKYLYLEHIFLLTLNNFLLYLCFFFLRCFYSEMECSYIKRVYKIRKFVLKPICMNISTGIIHNLKIQLYTHAYIPLMREVSFFQPMFSLIWRGFIKILYSYSSPFMVSIIHSMTCIQIKNSEIKLTHRAQLFNKVVIIKRPVHIKYGDK